MSTKRFATDEDIAAHNAAIEAIVVTDEAVRALTVLTNPKDWRKLHAFQVVKEFCPQQLVPHRHVKAFNDCVNKVHELPRKLAAVVLPLSPLEEALFTHAPNLLLLATDGKRFKTRKEVTITSTPVPHVEYGTGVERDETETRCLFASRRHRLVSGPDAIRSCILSALECTRDGFTPRLLSLWSEPRAGSVGVWKSYCLNLYFTNAVDDSTINMCSTDERICNALTVPCPFAKKRVLDALGTEVNNRFIVKIKELLRTRDLRDMAEGRRLAKDAMVYCSEPTCEHASGYLAPRPYGTETYGECSNGHQTCLKCMTRRHPGSCDAAASMDAETREMLVGSTKSCPGCSTLITKNDGCNHMTCRCGQHFCWRCLKPFSHLVRWMAHDSDDGVTCTVGMDVYGDRFD
jgi:hypothetical protein